MGFPIDPTNVGDQPILTCQKGDIVAPIEASYDLPPNIIEAHQKLSEMEGRLCRSGDKGFVKLLYTSDEAAMIKFKYMDRVGSLAELHGRTAKLIVTYGQLLDGASKITGEDWIKPCIAMPAFPAILTQEQLSQATPEQIEAILEANKESWKEVEEELININKTYGPAALNLASALEEFRKD